MEGVYIECDYCGTQQCSKLGNYNSLRRVLVERFSWVSLKKDTDFCSEECFKKFIKLNQPQQP